MKDSYQDPFQPKLSTFMPIPVSISSPEPTWNTRTGDRSGSDVQILNTESEPESNPIDHSGIADQRFSSSDHNPLTQTVEPGAGIFAKLPHISKNSNHRSSGRSKNSKLLAFRRGIRSHPGTLGESEDDDDDEEIELQMWERHGIAVVEVPWFRSKVEA